MKSIGVLLFALVSICSTWGCGSTNTPKPVSARDRMMTNAEEYVLTMVHWINRDGWYSTDGTKEEESGVSYGAWVSDWDEDFVVKINASSTGDDQQYWSEYTSYRPGMRKEGDDPQELWTGVNCKALVYRAATKAGYSIPSHYLNDPPTAWQNLGTEVLEPQEGDLVLMDFNNDLVGGQKTYEHLGIIWGYYPDILSAVAIYQDPFHYKAGWHNEAQYNAALAEEFQGQNLYVYDMKYIRLAEP